MSLYFDHKIESAVDGTTRYKGCRSVLWYIGIFLSVVFVGGELNSNLYAQRSKPYVKVNSALIENNLQGYPGLFDTNTVGHGSLVLEVPSVVFMLGSTGSLVSNVINSEDEDEEDGENEENNKNSNDDSSGSGFSVSSLLNCNVDYGINSSFSLGVNPLIFVPLASGGAGGSLRARTKVYEGSNFIDVVTFSAGGLSMDIAKNVSVSLNYFLFSNNASFILSPKSSFTVSSQFFSFSANALVKEVEGMDDDVNAGSIELMTSFLAGNYQYSFNRHFGASAVLVWPFYVDAVVDTTNLRMSVDAIGLNFDKMLLRLGGHLNLGSSNMLEGGVSYIKTIGGVILWVGYSHNFS